MRAWNVLNDGYLDDLFKCSLEEINDVYKDYMKYIKTDDYMNWQFEMNELQKRYRDEMKEVDVYESGDYQLLLKNEQLINLDMTPDFKRKIINNRNKVAKTNLIIKYYDSDIFEQNKSTIKILLENTSEKRKMTPADLLKELYSLGSRIWIFFYTLGIIQFKYRCLISQLDRDVINVKFTRAVKTMNKHCALNSFYDIFNYNHKINLELQEAFLPDNKSLVNLIFPVLNKNIDELCKICEIINKHKDYKEKNIRIKEINQLVSEGLRTGAIERV